MSSDAPVDRTDSGPLATAVALVGRRRARWSAPSARRSSPAQFFRAYLAAYLFYLGIALGSMVLLMVYHLTGGSWGLLIRRILEAAMRTLPLLAVLFLPIACGNRLSLPLGAARGGGRQPETPIPAVLSQSDAISGFGRRCISPSGWRWPFC